MKISRQMLHDDLKPYFVLFMLVPLIFRHKWFVQLANHLISLIYTGKDIKGLSCDEVFVASNTDDYRIRVRLYRPLQCGDKLPVLLYIHGGGYIFGNPEMFESSIRRFIQTRPCVVVAPDYRKAFAEPYPAGFNDCYNTLLWIKANSDQLRISGDKIMVAGHSAGGGLAAAVSIKARDTQDVRIAFQMPLYPMIDHLQPEDPAREMQSPAWDTKANRLGWNAYLRKIRKESSVIPAYASPAGIEDYSGLPPTITFVGKLEPFYQETIRYVEGLRNAGVDVAFKIYEGCFHGFDIAMPKTDIGKNGLGFTFDSFAQFYDKYIG